MLTDEQLAEWQALAEAATPGPWELRGDGDAIVAGPELVAFAAPVGYSNSEIVFNTPADAALMALSRTAIPALIAEVRRLRALVAPHGIALSWVDQDGVAHSTFPESARPAPPPAMPKPERLQQPQDEAHHDDDPEHPEDDGIKR
jgi:hypothetical protein